MDQVTETLWVSDIHDVQTQSTSRFDTVVTVCQDTVESNIGDADYHHFPLSDGPPDENSYNPGEFTYELFETAVETVVSAVRNNNTTVVHCHAGRSRSPMVIAAALTELHDLSFRDAETVVSDARTTGIQPSNEIREFAKQYAGETQ